MKKRIIALISFLCYIICWAQAADEHYYFKTSVFRMGYPKTLSLLFYKIERVLCGLVLKTG